MLWQVADLSSEVVLGGPGRALDLPSAARDASDPAQIAAMTNAALEIGMAPEMLELIGDDTVHIDPQDTSLAVLTGMNWQPVPVFQSYVAYTPHLDRLNADAIVESGPTWILRQPDRAIDGRNPAWESPLYQLAVLCNYDIELEAMAFQLLGRRDASRCGEERPLDGPVGGDGQPVAVPDAPASDDLVLVRVDCEPIRFERILGVLFKPRHQIWATTDAGRFRLVPAHLDSPLIVRSRDIQVEQLHVIGCGSDPTYEFTTRRW